MTSRNNGCYGKPNFLNQNNDPMRYLNGTMKRSPMEAPTKDKPDVRPGEVPRRQLSASRQQHKGAQHHRKTKSVEIKANRMQQDGTRVKSLLAGYPIPDEPTRRRPHQRGFETDGLQTKSLMSPDAPWGYGMQRAGNMNYETKITVLKRPHQQNREVYYTQPTMMNQRGDVQLSALEALLRKDMQQQGLRGIPQMQRNSMMMGGMQQTGGMQQNNMMGGGFGASVMNGMMGNRPMLPQMYRR